MSRRGRSVTRYAPSLTAAVMPSTARCWRPTACRFHKGLSVIEAAGIPESFFAVWSNVFMGVGLTAGETFLVHGGAGGIGTSAIQLAKAFGARVYATDSPAERCAACTQLGADRVIDYNEEDFVEVMRNEAKGANVILDIVGGDYIARNIRAAAPDARIIQLAFNKGSTVEINLMPIMLKRLVYTGSTLRSRPDAFKTEIARQPRDQVWPLIEAGTIKPLLSHTFPLAQAADGIVSWKVRPRSARLFLKLPYPVPSLCMGVTCWRAAWQLIRTIATPAYGTAPSNDYSVPCFRVCTS